MICKFCGVTKDLCFCLCVFKKHFVQYNNRPTERDQELFIIYFGGIKQTF